MATTQVDDDVDYDDQELTGYQARLARLRDQKGVARLRFGSTTGFVLLRHADVESAFRDDGRFSKSAALAPITFPVMSPNIMGYDGREHTVKRGLVSPAFRRTVIPRYIAPLFRPTAEELADELAPLGEADLQSTFAKKYPMRIITRLLGIPRHDEDKMASWAVAMLNRVADPDATTRANAEFTEYVAPLVEERRAHPGGDLLSAIVTEEVEGERLGDDEVFGFLRLLFPAGVDTTWLTLGNLMVAVLDRIPKCTRGCSPLRKRGSGQSRRRSAGSRPRAPSRGRPSRTWSSRAVEIPAGELVRLAVPVANRDPKVFADPDRWDLDRRPTNHLAFGLGRHFCLGAFLARGELQVALEVLLRRLPNLRLVEEPRISGVILRGPRSLRLAWDAP